MPTADLNASLSHWPSKLHRACASCQVTGDFAAEHGPTAHTEEESLRLSWAMLGRESRMHPKFAGRSAEVHPIAEGWG